MCCWYIIDSQKTSCIQTTKWLLGESILPYVTAQEDYFKTLWRTVWRPLTYSEKNSQSWTGGDEWQGAVDFLIYRHEHELR